MEESAFRQPELVGREEELAKLKHHLDNAIAGKGSTVLVSGEAGIGKTRLIQEFREHAARQDVKIISGAAAADAAHPFLIFSKALESEIARPLFHEQEYTSFTSIFAINRAGLLVAQASPEEGELDADIFAGMLSAVQDFVRDSFDSSGQQKAGLGRLEYGDMIILIEHGQHLFLTAVFKGAEHADMKALLGRAVRSIEAEHGDILESWSGQVRDIEPVQEKISSLADVKFLVRKDMEGIQLKNERLRIANEVLKIIVDKSEQKPLLLFLEDLHWADESSLFVLDYVARNIAGEKVLVISTLRPSENDTLLNIIKSTRDEGMLKEIVLEKLGSESVSCLVDEMYPENAFPPVFIENLSTKCDGNPFFVREMLWQMNEEGSIARQNGQYMLVSEDYSIPDSVEEIVHRRLQNLEPDAMTMAEYVSCIGKEFDRDAALSFQSLDDAPSALDKLQGAGVIIVKNGTAEFNHAIFHDITYRTIGDRWKLAYHKSLGEYYETVYGDRLDGVLYELARHYSRSNAHLKAFEYCIKAAEKAESAYAPEQAIEFYENVLKAVPHIQQRDEEAIKVKLRIGENYQLLGRLEDAENVYRQTIELAEERHDEELLAGLYTNLGNTLCHKPEYDEASALTQKAFEMYSAMDDKVGMYKTMTNQGYLYFYQGKYDEALELYNEQLKLAEDMGDKLRVGRTLSDIGGIYWDTGDYDQALENNKRYLAIAEELGDKHAIKDALSGLANVSYYQKNYSYAEDCYKKLIEVSDESGDIFMSNLGSIGLGALYELMGKYDEATNYLLKSLEIGRKMSYKQGLPYILIYLGRIDLNTGNYEKAKEYFQEALDISEITQTQRTLNFAQSSMGTLYKRLKEYEKAEKLYNDAIEIGKTLDNKHVLSDNIYQKAELCFMTGRLDEAEALNDEALAIAEQIDRNHIIFHGNILKSKLLSKTGKKDAIDLLEKMLAETKENKERGAILYELFHITGNEAQQREVHELYTKLYEATPNIIYKERSEELKD